VLFVEAMTANTTTADRTELEEIKHEVADHLPEEGRKKIKVIPTEHGAVFDVYFEADANIHLSLYEVPGYELQYISTRPRTQELVAAFFPRP
jgi:hypothetical protein